MNYLYPAALTSLIEELSRLPGIGPKTAQRLAFYLLSRPQEEVLQFAATVEKAKLKIKNCSRCGHFTDADLCFSCLDEKRANGFLCVVETSRDVVAIEKTGAFHGRYHVLNGVISPLEGKGPETLNLANLKARIQQEQIREVIIATSSTVEGEATAIYLAKYIKKGSLKVTRIAHGLPVGGDLEYADELTLSSALEGRQEF